MSNRKELEDRLTYKVDYDYEGQYGANCAYSTSYNLSSVYDKLGQLEDIEEEVGVDLVTLFKALKDGIYYAYIDDYVLPELYYDEEAMNSDDELDGFTFKVTYFDEVYKTRRTEILSVKYDYKLVWALHKSDIK